MRLDTFLIKKGYFRSRNRAKIAIRQGLVVVDGKIAVKPSIEVDEDVEIKILDDKPAGYWKLREIDEKFFIFKGDEIVLDLGSSVGGFLLYASEKAKFVYGIEINEEFEEELKRVEEERKNVKIFIENVFTFDIDKIDPVNLILNDLTMDFSSSMKALKRFLPKLKNGKILFVAKGDEEVDFSDFQVLAFDVAKKKKESYYLIEPKMRKLI
ncbi:MAG: S4 domain-containing protein [Archaeoglobaceae archaeon]|nr:S4 domain-containing protein [Archaeoglobaceae archaeon]MDW7989945.1 S4 domain-containing protein [Archaeoglobaceae archaeon]